MTQTEGSRVRTIEVTYWNGDVVQVRAASIMKTEDVLELQKSLIAQFLYAGAMLGNLLLPSNTRVWEDMKRLGELLPIVGPDGGFLDPTQIQDPDELCRIFFTRTLDRDDETGAISPADEEPYKPSDIARLHGLNFYGLEGILYQARQRTGKMMQEARLQLEQDLKAEAEQEQAQTETPVPPKTKKTTTRRKATALPATA